MVYTNTLESDWMPPSRNACALIHELHDYKVQPQDPALCSDLHVGPGDQQHNPLTLIAREQGHGLFPVLDVFPIYLENK